MDALLDVKDLWVEARMADGQTTPIVKGISFTVKRGEVIALIGESGSGKTTTALATMGYARAGCRIARGEVRLDGIDVLGLDRESLRRLRGRKISYLPQSAAATFNPALTIDEQVTESAILHGVYTRDEARRHARELYRRLDLPDPERLGSRYPHQVSGGQLQRLMAAKALCGGPDLLLLDEPTTALDVTTQIEVLAAFNDIVRDTGMAAIYVTHDLAVVAQVADRILVLYDGETKEAGESEQIITRPNHAYTRRLMRAIRPPPATSSPASQDNEESGQPPLMTADNIVAGYGRQADGRPAAVVLHGVNTALTRGSVVGVIGESGCGKSTLARVIAGLLPARAGATTFKSQALAARLEDRSKDQLKAIQIVFQMADTALNPRQRVGEILGRPLQLFLGLRGTEKERRVGELLDMVELPRHLANRFPDELSGGQKQRVNLARALAADPDVILCDEVTSSLDTIVGSAVIDLLKQLRDKLALSYLFISHDLSTVASFADRIVVLYAGRVVEDGMTGDVLSPPYHPYTRLLLSSVPELRQGWLADVMRTREAKAGIAQAIDHEAKGCPFHARCPLVIDGVCDSVVPWVHEPKGGHRIACHRTIDELASQ